MLPPPTLPIYELAEIAAFDERVRKELGETAELVYTSHAIEHVPDAAAGAVLRQNYPNPFNPSTRIDFVLDQPDPLLSFGRKLVDMGALGEGDR